MDNPRDFGHYLSRIWSALSQLVNVAFLLGHPNESISGRSHREGWPVERWIDRLFFWQLHHCRSAHESDVRWAQGFVPMSRESDHV